MYTTMAPKYYGEPAHLIGVGIGMIMLDVFFVGLRFWTRRRQSQTWAADDWLLVPATLLTLGMAALVIWSVSQRYIAYPLDIPDNITMKDFGLMSTEKMVFASKLDYYFLIFMCPCLGLIKTSCLFFYKRTFGPEYGSTLHYIVNAAIAITILWTVAFFGAHVFECGSHFYAIWGDAESYLSHCARIPRLVFAFCLTDLVTNLILVLIPIPLIWASDMSKSKKLATMGVFALGTVALSASGMRLGMAVKASGFSLSGSKAQDLPSMSTAMIQTTDDVFLTIALRLYWALVECGVGIAAACLPALTFLKRPLTLLLTGQFKYAHHSAFVSSAEPAGGRVSRATKKRSHWRAGSSGSEETAASFEKEMEAGVYGKWVGARLDKAVEASYAESRVHLPATSPSLTTRPDTAVTRADSGEGPDPAPEAGLPKRASRFQEVW